MIWARFLVLCTESQSPCVSGEGHCQGRAEQILVIHASAWVGCIGTVSSLWTLISSYSLPIQEIYHAQVWYHLRLLAHPEALTEGLWSIQHIFRTPNERAGTPLSYRGVVQGQKPSEGKVKCFQKCLKRKVEAQEIQNKQHNITTQKEHKHSNISKSEQEDEVTDELPERKFKRMVTRALKNRAWHAS